MVLWHFDPWWLLANPPYEQHPATPTLKATNAVTHLPSKLISLYYRRDLSAIAGIAFRDKEEAHMRSWKSAWLPSDRPPVAATTARAGPRWVLAPAWAIRTTDLPQVPV
jgi:hypothetical protein